MINIKWAFEYTQGSEKFYSTILSFTEINDNFSPFVYNSDNKLGYQRAISPNHLDKMVSSLKKNPDENISPNSIILAIDELKLKELIVHNNKIEVPKGIVQIDFLKLSKMAKENGRSFRIVDGQHRMAAIAKYSTLPESRTNPKNNMLFNVIVYSVPEDQMINEVNLFTDINSKSKRLRTDLAIMAKYNLEMLEPSNDIDYKLHITIRTILAINTTKNSNKLFNSIKIDPNDQNHMGAVSIKAFIEAIYSIVSYTLENDLEAKELFEELQEISKDENQRIDNKIDEIAEKLTKRLFIPMWDIIFKQWPETVYKNKQYLDIEDDDEDHYFYNKDYYIQQTMGVKSLSYLMYDCVKSFEGLTIDEMLDQYSATIRNSKITNDDWKRTKIIQDPRNPKKIEEVAGTFKGMSSEAGYKKIMNKIKNNE